MNNHNTLPLINKNSAQPLYQQIKEVVYTSIRQGKWQTGQKIPSENKLVEMFKVSRMTVHRALRELTSEGILNRVHGLGTFISEAPRHASLLQLKDIAEEIQSQGQTHSSNIIMHLKIKAASMIADRMQLTENTEVFYLKAIHFQGKQPIQLEERYVNPQLVPDFMNIDFKAQTATRYLMELFRPDEMEHRVQAIMPDSKTREILKMDERQPCLKLSRRTWKNNQIVTYATMLYPGDRYDLTAKYLTNDYQIVNH